MGVQPACPLDRHPACPGGRSPPRRWLVVAAQGAAVQAARCNPATECPYGHTANPWGARWKPVLHGYASASIHLLPPQSSRRAGSCIGTVGLPNAGRPNPAQAADGPRALMRGVGVSNLGEREQLLRPTQRGARRGTKRRGMTEREAARGAWMARDARDGVDGACLLGRAGHARYGDPSPARTVRAELAGGGKAKRPLFAPFIVPFVPLRLPPLAKGLLNHKGTKTTKKRKRSPRGPKKPYS